MFRLLFVLCLLTVLSAQAQESERDTTRTLSEVIVQAYAADRPIQEVPVAIGIVKEAELNRFSPVSLLPAVNMIPGAKMEERSPGSYRFAIRGSSLRSPFGIRNVKFYWNGLPLTDGGGNTYLNLLDFNSIGSMEIIKGPGGSIYGAGMGGVVLLNSPSNKGLQYSVTGGSYGLFRIQGSGSLTSTEKFQMNLRMSYQQSDGYRQQTAMNRFTGQINFRSTISPKSFLSGTILTSQLFYETPGGLTKTQYDSDPTLARPSTPTQRGAVAQQAAITNKTGYAGLSFDHTWNNRWSSRIGMFVSRTDFKNPSIRNYETRLEENWGGRTDTQYAFEKKSVKGKITFGAEYQHFYSPITDYDNNLGTSGNVQTDDVLRSQIFLGFAQAELDLPLNLFLTVGASANFINYQFTRTSVTPNVSQERNFDPVISPRVALLKKISSNMSIYGSISNGFSPPSLAEVRPSTAAFNNTLNSERGISYELGMKSRLFNQLEAMISLYDFRLDQAIVIQRDASGADYFVNAGATSQQGAEVFLGWTPVVRSGKISSFRIWTSYSYNHYRFKDYVNDGKDYSGNELTGVAPAVVAFGADVQLRKGFYANLTGNYSDRLPLNDANTDFTQDYFLLGARVGYKLQKSKLPLEIFAGIDNAFDRKYSLGNDLNAAGGRYYNAALGRNYFGGIALRLNQSKK
ncbi:TonB-dependent receptor PqqU [soil metagenome]